MDQAETLQMNKLIRKKLKMLAFAVTAMMACSMTSCLQSPWWCHYVFPLQLQKTRTWKTKYRWYEIVVTPAVRTSSPHVPSPAWHVPGERCYDCLITSSKTDFYHDLVCKWLTVHGCSAFILICPFLAFSRKPEYTLSGNSCVRKGYLPHFLSGWVSRGIGVNARSMFFM